MNVKLPNQNSLKIIALFLKEKLDRYYQQYREILISHGMIPIRHVVVPSLAKKELQIDDEYNSSHRRLTWRRED